MTNVQIYGSMFGGEEGIRASTVGGNRRDECLRWNVRMDNLLHKVSLHTVVNGIKTMPDITHCNMKIQHHMYGQTHTYLRGISIQTYSTEGDYPTLLCE